MWGVTLEMAQTMSPERVAEILGPDGIAAAREGLATNEITQNYPTDERARAEQFYRYDATDLMIAKFAQTSTNRVAGVFRERGGLGVSKAVG